MELLLYFAELLIHCETDVVRNTVRMLTLVVKFSSMMATAMLCDGEQ